MSQRRIAVLVASMLIGAQVGIAAVDGPFSPTEEYAEPAPDVAEAAEPAPVADEAPGVEQMAAADQASPVERAPAAEYGYVVPARARTLLDATFPPLANDAFPPSTDDRPLLPALIEYLDRRAATIELASAGSREPVFPPSYISDMHPALVAYFERVEAARLAAAQPQPSTAVTAQPEMPSSEEQATGSVTAGEGAATAGSGG